MNGELWSKLKDKEYRDAYLVAKVTYALAYQIEALRNQHGWTQAELAKQIGTTQSVISRLEDPDYGRANITTLFDLAGAFDVGLLVKFVSYSQFASEYRDVSPEGLSAASFIEEDSTYNQPDKPEDTFASNANVAGNLGDALAA